MAYQRRGGGVATWLWIVLAVAGGLILLFILIPLLTADETAGPDVGADVEGVRDVGEPGAVGEAGPIGDVVGEPTRFFGQTVTVSAEVEEVISPRAFTLDAPGADVQDLLVVSAQSFEPAFAEDNVVQVTGVVRRFQLNEIEQEVGAFEDDAAFAEFEGRPVIIATQVERAVAP